MFKKVIALAVTGLASGALFAQANVTVYGLLDAGYNEVHTDGARTERSIDSSQTAGSRLGFKGSEDLGGGLKALFVLEYALANDINSTIGSASKWSATATRQAYVGLGSDYGTLTLGRLQTAAFNWACTYSPLTGGIFGTDLRLGARTYSDCGNAGRADNAVGYVSPNLAGLTIAGNHILRTEGESANVADDYANQLGITYLNGGLQVGLIYNQVSRNKVPGSTTRTTDSDIREYGIGATYDFKVVKLFASYANNKVEGFQAESKYQVGATVPVFENGLILGSFAANSMIGDETDSKIWSVAYNHSLSKRSVLYAGYGLLTNEAKAQRGMGPPANPSIGQPAYPLPPLGGNSSIFGLGIRHSF